MRFPKSLFVAIFSTIVLALIVAGCAGGSSGGGMTTMATVQASISDPATCSTGSGGTYQHVYITVTDVQISQSSSDSGWVDLAPGMAPKQIDLLGNPANQCFLAQLGAQQIQAGSYQQIRIMLLANNNASQLTGTNPCGANAANCVVLADNSVHTLQLSSEAQTGLKIPSGQIAGGNFTVAAGANVDLNIDFNTCMSIVRQGNGQFRLKPVLHAGEVSLQTSSISGTIVDSGTTTPIPGATTVVALEQFDSATGVDRVVMQTLADQTTGAFTFCPVPTGTYDVVAVTINGQQSYAATITTGVAQGTAIGKIPMVAVSGTNTSDGSITGQITSAGASGGIAVDVTLSATQSVTIGSQATLVTIPLAGQSPATASAIVSTASGASCPANTFCASYTVSVPAANPNVGAFSSGGTTYTQDTTNPNQYTMDGQAFQQSVSTPTLDCSPSDVQVNTLTPTGPITVVAGGPAVTASTMTFTGCQ